MNETIASTIMKRSTSEDEDYSYRMLSTDERVELLYGVVHSIILRAFGLQQTLAKQKRERKKVPRSGDITSSS